MTKPGRLRLADAGRRAVWGAAGVAAASLLYSITFQNAGAIAVLPIVAIAGIAAARPYDALLIAAGLWPLTTIFQVAIGDAQSSVRFAEALALAFIAGASLHRAAERRRFAVPATIVWPALVLVAAALASAIIEASVLRVEQPGFNTWHGVPLVLLRNYLILNNGVTDATLFAEGLVLLLLAADLCAGNRARRESVLLMMVAGAAGAAFFNVVRIVEAALSRPQFWSSVGSLFLQVRVNVHFPDRNAAGSYFAMMLFVGLAGLRRRSAYVIPVLLLAAAVWLTGSRTAMATVVIVAAGWTAVAQWRPGRRLRLAIVVVALMVAGGAAGWKWYPPARNDPAAFSLTSRLELARAGLQMAAEHPVFGVGIGQYYVLSARFADPHLLAFMWRPHENAHDYYVQILAELGVPGLLLFVTVIGMALREAAAAEPRPAGLMAGLLAFLITCWAGHPLLTPVVAYAFWIAMGVAAASRTNVSPTRSPTRSSWRIGAAAAIVLLAVSIPVRAREAVRHADLANTTVGLSLWNWHDQVRFRWAGQRSTQYYSSAVRGIRIPLECGPDAPSDLEVVFFFDGHEANRIIVPKDGRWHDVSFILGSRGDADFTRVDVEVHSVDGRPLDEQSTELLMIGQATTSGTQ